MSYSAFYSSAVAIRRNLGALDGARLEANAQGTGDANAKGTLMCHGGGSGVNHGQAGAGAKGEPTTQPEPVGRGYLRGFLSPFEF